MNLELNQRRAPFDEVPGFVKVFTFFGLFLACLVGSTIFGSYLASAITGTQISMNNLEDHNVILGLKIMQIVSSFGGFVIPVIIYSLLVSVHPFEYLQMNRLGKPLTFILGGVLMLFAFPLINYLAELNSHLKLPASMQAVQDFMKSSEDEATKVTNAFLEHQGYKGLLLNLFMMAFIAALGEELFFRAALQNMLIKGTRNIHVGIWLTAIIFSAIHMEFFGFLPRMLMGAYLGYLYVWSKSIWVPIFAHFVNNASAVFLAFLEERHAVPQKIEQVGSDSSEILYVVISTVLVALILFAIYKIENKKTVIAVE